ncbi:MAG: hypothetical protein R2705_12570 [Ilumatobacteraceae bacterium]
MGLDLGGQLTRTGGLTFAGGPWNNYVMHAIATMVSDLRPARRVRAGVGQQRLRHQPPSVSTPLAHRLGLPSRGAAGRDRRLARRRLAPPTDAAGPATSGLR